MKGVLRLDSWSELDMIAVVVKKIDNRIAYKERNE
jgi:hypothetical protein